ncbi:LacI family DNA-binding transcriptional regulator [Amnibacterium flavum]|uniref:LacI family transcriptional regulator n=1 Tax=Amnibacterium flavum TaxID=2173173 RepID=A0A2V1HT55_9MICO|nr:LacI family DNA-binding transcriptional regulator [Amnibacterium flavum]PVZ95753.1 LacI family transcriptional regulator [Amnibacterium flavum]
MSIQEIGRGPSRATLSRVAEEASVSISTVSKVLNGRSGVSDATRARVEELLKDHRYNRRNSGQTVAPLVELVFQQIDGAWAVEIIQGVERVARENGMSVILTESGDRHSPAATWIDGVLQRRPAGVILILSDLSPSQKHQLRTRKIPFVLVDPTGDPAPDVPSIGSANWNGGYLATRHLVELGHRQIAMITGPEDIMCSTARLSGYRAALEGAGIPFRADYVTTGNFDYESGVARARELLELEDAPTAIFAGSDLQALGVYEAARSAGISIPDELSVVGYDDLKLASWAGPPLTTVRQPLTEMAEEATRLVLRLRTEEQVDNLRLDLATRLIVRGSTRPLS